MKLWERERNLALRTRRIAVIVLFFFAAPVPELLLAGVAALAAGSIIMILSFGMLRKREELATRGPYAFCRHPGYLGMLVSALGFCLAAGWHLSAIALSAAFLAISVPFYYRKIKFEEVELGKIHGESFVEYKKRVKRKLIPSLVSGIRNGGFAIRLSFEASIRNHSLKRAATDGFWFLVFVAKWYYLRGSYPFGRILWTGRYHSYLLTGALATMLALYLVFKYLDHRYRKARKDIHNRQSLPLSA